jgi:hypothetical protein
MTDLPFRLVSELGDPHATASKVDVQYPAFFLWPTPSPPSMMLRVVLALLLAGVSQASECVLAHRP